MQKTTQGRFLTFGAYPRKLVQLLEEDWGIPAEKVLEGTGLTRAQLDTPELVVPFADVVAMFNNGFRLSQSTDLGLRYAAQLRPSSHGLLGAAVLTGSNLQSAIDLFYDYVGLIAPFLLLHQEDRRHNRVLVLELISDVPGVDPVMTYDIMLLSTFNILKLIIGERTRELVFHFAHPAPAHADAYARYFDGHVQFNASCYGVSIPREFLDARVPTADEDTHRLLVGQISERMDLVHAQSSFVDSVRFHLKRTDGPLPRMSSVASAFNMSARTFRNRLRRHNTSFQSLLDKERHEQAVHYLRGTDKSVKEIAYILGFQESSNFSRVFKKWTGVTPLDYRRGGVGGRI
ncbi:MAG TPA: AraC family transcriptional regulator [Moraxellaceae bacterium]